MARVKTLGFSALLRLLDANEKPQRNAIKNRYVSRDARDFHRSFHLSIKNLLTGISTFRQAIRSAQRIKKQSERQHTKSGIVRFLRWYISLGTRGTAYPSIILPSPMGLFQVKFDPDCIIDLNGRRTAIHIWNSSKKINPDQALAALSLVAAKFPLTFDRPDDFAVLSLQSGDIYKWSDANKEHTIMALHLMTHLDRVFTLIRSELDIPSSGDQPQDPRPYL